MSLKNATKEQPTKASFNLPKSFRGLQGRIAGPSTLVIERWSNAMTKDAQGLRFEAADWVLCMFDKEKNGKLKSD